MSTVAVETMQLTFDSFTIEDYAVTIRLITPDDAASILEETKYPHQRNIRTNHVAMLAREMTERRFVPATSIRISYTDDGAFLLDGQHRLRAIVKSQKAQIVCVVEEDTVGGMLGLIYGCLDRGTQRQIQDFIKPIALDETLGLSTSVLIRMNAAARFISSGLTDESSSQRITVDKSVHLLTLYAPHMHTFSATVPGVNREISKALNRAYVIAFALLTFRYSTALDTKSRSVAEFWRGVAYDDGLAANDPRKQIHKHFITTKMNQRTKYPNDTSLVVPLTGIHLLAACFNAYMSGKKMTRQPTINTNDPIQILGVPSDPAEWVKP